jgi:hypothetical protein
MHSFRTFLQIPPNPKLETINFVINSCIILSKKRDKYMHSVISRICTDFVSFHATMTPPKKLKTIPYLLFPLIGFTQKWVGQSKIQQNQCKHFFHAMTAEKIVNWTHFNNKL